MDLITFLVCLTACFTAGATGALFPTGQWYVSLDKPSWTPPNWLFPIAWTSLYIAIAVAAARVAPSPEAGLPIALWALQIALNTLWTPVFFGLRRIRDAIFVITLLWLAVAATMVAFFQIDWIAGTLFVPYLIWCSYAGALNIAMWRRNPDVKPLVVNEAA